MHEAQLISTWLELREHLPSLSTLLFSLPVFGFLLFAGWRSASSRSKSRAADRILTKQIDDKGVPLFFDLDTHDSNEFNAGGVCDNRARQR
jgi:hypothetical protein